MAYPESVVLLMVYPESVPKWIPSPSRSDEWRVQRFHPHSHSLRYPESEDGTPSSYKHEDVSPRRSTGTLPTRPFHTQRTGNTPPPLHTPMAGWKNCRSRIHHHDRCDSTGSIEDPNPSSLPRVLASSNRTDPACCTSRASRIQRYGIGVPLQSPFFYMHPSHSCEDRIHCKRYHTNSHNRIQ